MKKYSIILFLLVVFNSEAQTKRPKKLQRTPANREKNCMLPIFEIEDASDLCDSLKEVTSIREIKRLLTKINSHWSDFELYSDDCYCINKLEDEIFLFSPEDEIEKALKSNNINDIKELIKTIDYNVGFMWLLASDCD